MALFVREDVADADRAAAPADVANELDDRLTALIDVAGTHQEVGEAQRLHAQRVDLVGTADDGRECEADRLRPAILGQFEPGSPPWARALLSIERRAARSDDRRAACIMISADSREPPGPVRPMFTL